jgi:hypothetical protein
VGVGVDVSVGVKVDVGVDVSVGVELAEGLRVDAGRAMAWGEPQAATRVPRPARRRKARRLSVRHSEGGDMRCRAF